MTMRMTICRAVQDAVGFEYLCMNAAGETTMRVIGGFGPTGDRDLPAGDSHDYATWDAAYVLGSLSPTDRREFEAHLSVCPSCSQSVGELSGIPALLSKLDRGTVAAMDADGHTAAPEPTPNLLPSLMTEVRRRRRRTRMVTWTTGAAAAVLLSVGLFLGISGLHPTSSPPQAGVLRCTMDQVGTTALASTVALSSQQLGHLHRPQLRLPGSGDCSPRQAGDGRGESRRHPHSAGHLGR